MGRWVTSKGRRIYIPGEGEEPSSGPKIDLEDYGAVSEFKGMLPEMEYD